MRWYEQARAGQLPPADRTGAIFDRGAARAVDVDALSILSDGALAPRVSVSGRRSMTVAELQRRITTEAER